MSNTLSSTTIQSESLFLWVATSSNENFFVACSDAISRLNESVNKTIYTVEEKQNVRKIYKSISLQLINNVKNSSEKLIILPANK